MGGSTGAHLSLDDPPERPDDPERSAERRRASSMPRWVGSAVGVLSLAAGLVLSELVTGVFSRTGSPIVVVGNRIVDLVPDAIRNWAISTFGTNDKAVLLVGVACVLVIVAAVAGNAAVKRHHVAAVSIVVATVALGAVSSRGRGAAGAMVVVSTVLGGALSLILLWKLADRAAAAWGPGGVDTDSGDPGYSRRRFMKVSAGVAGATALGAGVAVWVRSNAAVAVERLGITLPRPKAPLPPVPEGVDVGLDGVSPFFTPNEDFYRIDTALVVPRVSTQGWTLRVHGLVDREVSLDYPSLLDRPLLEVDATIACVSNYVGGDLIGNARWLGCRLDDLLSEAGIDPSADEIVGRSVDGFTAGFPTATLDGRDAIVAVGMNGEPLPTEHGYPARLIVPGLFGYVSATKWLSDIELTRFEDFEGYWIPRGWNRKAPVTTSSRIDTPTGGKRVDAGRRLGVGGVSWAMVRGVEAVELRVDDGPWEQATLGERYSSTTWRQWRHTVELTPGEHDLAVRATDTDGMTQSGERHPPGPGASSGWHTVTVSAA